MVEPGSSDSTVLEVAMQFAGKVQRLGSDLGLLGNLAVSSKRSVIEQLRSSAATLVHSLQHNVVSKDAPAIIDKIAGELQLCHSLGTISSSELDSYFTDLDKLQDLITKEKA